MHVTRRTFLHTAITASMTFAVIQNSGSVFGQKAVDEDLYPLPVETYSHPLYSMTAKQFESLIGQAFSVTSPDGSVRDLVLTEVKLIERLGNTVRGYYGESFSLILESRGGGAVLAQDTYELRGDGLPQFSVLLVPVGREQKEYEVLMNRLTR